MRWLIRTIHRKGKTQLSYEDDVHYGDTLTIGRGTDQAIFVSDVRAALQHARITLDGGGRYRIESLIVAGVRVNGGIVQTAALSPGDVVEIGTTRLEMIAPPQDFEGGVEISQADRADSGDVRAKLRATSLSETWLARRAPSWIGIGVVLLFALLLPLMGHFAPAVDGFLRATPLPSRSSWQAGPLAGAHRFFGHNCTSCHTVEFRWVRDDACLTCHALTPAHADPAKFNLPELGEARCAHCHRDHNGAKALVRNDQALCSGCHQDLPERTAGASTLEDAADFGRSHPQFSVTLPAWDEQGQYTPRRVSLNEQPLDERSGLKFPHDTHLDPAGIEAPDGTRVLQCASCHAPEPGGAKMLPVDFETMCQDCHRLTFDITEPERQVPHAKIQEILYMLDEFYARRALDGEIRDPTAPDSVRTRRRPGQPVTREIRQEALTWARDKARRVGESLFTGQACSVCHVVSPGREVDQPWMVAPVRVAGVWFTKARFDHRSHTTMACGDCHEAARSHESRNVLIPDIANCRQCHGGEKGGTGLLGSSCTECHGYHESAHLLQRDL
ncbi:MAG TPA: cytochrome c3 family protein [Xanthomonadaceae bacterium]|nr:cytochrome c3 family protein [Xanthomonadaceae bacterium]